MPLIEIKTLINADLKTCFDLARDIDFHQTSLKHSKEKAVSGKTSGRIALGESVTWEAIHFGIKQRLTSKITEFNSPTYFVDEQVEGPFKCFKHEHIFSDTYNDCSNTKCTLMTDIFHYQSPFGALGHLANRLFLKRYMTKLLTARNEVLKAKAEEI